MFQVCHISVDSGRRRRKFPLLTVAQLWRKPSGLVPVAGVWRFTMRKSEAAQSSVKVTILQVSIKGKPPL
jgi:hypothetical protein